MTTPICRCRVLYLGSAVPHVTKDGLQGIQEPLKDLYPDQGPLSAKGIDSWLSVWSNGLLLENVDESRREVTRFFHIETLHYCAAVRHVIVPSSGSERAEKFLPLDSPFARHASPSHPPIFACILRRTTGIKVLECHAFICKKEAAANAMVRCCFHAYADSMYARQVEENPYYLESRKSRPTSGLDDVEAWRHLASPEKEHGKTSIMTNGSTSVSEFSRESVFRPPATVQEENYKVWTGLAPTEREVVYLETSGTTQNMNSTDAGSALGSSRSSRPRQMVLPSHPPPPPSNLILNSGKENKNKARPERMLKTKRGKQEIPHPVTNGMHSGPPAMSFPPPTRSTYATSGLCTDRRVKRGKRIPVVPVEEPIYLPSARPMSPTASYQPAAFPYDQYYLQHGTVPRPLRIHQKKKTHTKDKSSSDMDSLFDTGIYKKKGHLNERAFSYSIRQEHRSRSNSLANLHFLSNGDNPDISGSSGPAGSRTKHEPLRDTDKKEIELAHLVQGLDLKEDRSNSNGHESNFIRKKGPRHQR